MVSGTERKPLFPSPDAEGGWPIASDPREVRELAGLDPQALEVAAREQEWTWGGDAYAIAIVRHGILAAEFRTFNVLDQTRFDMWSVTKSFTGIAFGMLLGDRRSDPELAARFDLDSPAYDFIPEGHPLTDPRKATITIRHLLTMTSGMLGHIRGVAFGTPTALGEGLFEHALGFTPNRYGYEASTLIAEPGTQWEYSDPAFAHLSLIFSNLAGREIADYLNARLFNPIGVPPVSWSHAGGGSLIGPHTVPHTGLLLSARELARVGYLLLHGGVWHGAEIVPRDWVELATKPSQPFNPHYGYTFWTNGTGTLWPELPTDAFALMGFQGNRCWVIPSLDLVVARAASGPPVIDDRYFPARILEGLSK